MMRKSLCQHLDQLREKEGADFFSDRVPGFVYQNLRKGIGRRHYQTEAFGRFDYYWEHHANGKQPTQLLYHMATGSGKTLVMAGLIIYLYAKGYRHFLFFVNSTNIIDKTRDNFLNPSSAKYLFADELMIGQTRVAVREVDNFQSDNADDIQIVFSTVQGLHVQLGNPRENSLTFDDFEARRIVMISDEAHHINAETKRGKALSVDEQDELVSWEGTVNRVLNANAMNVMLEFTATVDFSIPEIARKYSDKLLFDYSLKQFRIDGFSKEVKVMQSDLPPFQRALQSMLLSQYRRKLFESNRLAIKPVILFKSRTIKDSQSFYSQFIDEVRGLTVEHLHNLRKQSNNSYIDKIFNYLDGSGIDLESFVEELRFDFAPERLIVVNSKDESEHKQLAINTLEDESNPYRAVFAVDKLNEGWDVLNLFDIVRLYDTKDGKSGKPSRTTMAEAQLIGRGARYCPFVVEGANALFTRKFDNELEHAMRICEELFYHSSYNPQYIIELTNALVDIGIKARADELPKDEKKRASKLVSSKSSATTVRDENALGAIPARIKIDLSHHRTLTQSVFGHPKNDDAVAKLSSILLKLNVLGNHILRKAIAMDSRFRFDRLKQTYPQLASVSEFITSESYLGNVEVEVLGGDETELDADTKLRIALLALEAIQ